MHTRRPQNILVTGGAGFIGSAFIRNLLSSEKAFSGTCTNLDLLTYAGNLENLASIEGDPRYRFFHGNITDQTLLNKIIQEMNVDSIVHFAAESHVDRSIHSPETFLQTNIFGTYHLLEAVKTHPHIHFHHISTDEVYGQLGQDGVFTEESPYAPSSPYSASKASSDHLVRAYAHTYGLSTTISNCSNNYGPYHFPEKFIPLMILNCLSRKPLPVYGRGENIRDWLHVDDHVDAVWKILQQGKSGSTYNIGGNSERRNIDLLYELIEIVAKATHNPSEELRRLVVFVSDRPGHDFRYAIDATKIKTDLGWEPKWSLKNGLEQTVHWYLENASWISRVQNGAYKEWCATNYLQR